MRTLRAVGVVGAALGGALGIGLFACGGTEGTGAPADSGPNDGVSPVDGGVPPTDGGGSHPDAGVCTNPTPIVIGGVDTGFVRCDEGYQHRVTRSDCPSLAPRGGVQCGPGVDSGMECGTDSDCKASPNGICHGSTGGAAICSCSYGCIRDTDCTAGQICECGDPVGFCVEAPCTDDSKCAPPALCAGVAGGFGGCGRASNTYVCQASVDRCQADKDCPTDDGGRSQICGYDPDAGARVCGEGPAACPGRPFLVDAAPRVAPLASRGDWLGGPAPDASRLTGDERATLAHHWARVGQMEHASVAAFARFALELLALGAPASMLVETSNAMIDETEHARLAFGLGSAYAARDVGPAPLSIDGALGDVTARGVFANLVREGCIGETIAAVTATEALAHAEDRSVREALGRIAVDETRHAALAWRAATWLVTRGDAAFRGWAADDLARAIAERELSTNRDSGRMAGPTSPRARAHGLPDPHVEIALVRAALHDLVTPCAAAMFGGLLSHRLAA